MTDLTPNPTDEDLAAAMKRMDELGVGIPQSVRIQGRDAVVRHVRATLKTYELELQEREEAEESAARETAEAAEVAKQDAAAELEALDVVVGDLPAVAEGLVGPAPKDYDTTPIHEETPPAEPPVSEEDQVSVDVDAEIQRLEASHAHCSSIRAMRVTLVQLEEYVQWAAETIEDLHKRTAKLGSTIVHVPESPSEETSRPSEG